MGFEKIANVYDHFNDLSLYEIWLDFVLEQLEEQPQLALDLGCGTGWFTQIMAPFVQDEIIGLDLSESMLSIAREQTIGSPGLRFVQGDMTNLLFEKSSFDLITSFFDVLNFLRDESAVQRAMNEVYRVLKPNGLFMFDVIMQPMLDEHYKDYEYFDSDDYASIMWWSQVEESQVEHHLLTFEHVKDDLYQRQTTTLVERVYPKETLLEMLVQAGFDRANISYRYDIEQENISTSAGKRLFIIAKK